MRRSVFGPVGMTSWPRSEARPSSVTYLRERSVAPQRSTRLTSRLQSGTSGAPDGKCVVCGALPTQNWGHTTPRRQRGAVSRLASPAAMATRPQADRNCWQCHLRRRSSRGGSAPAQQPAPTLCRHVQSSASTRKRAALRFPWPSCSPSGPLPELAAIDHSPGDWACRGPPSRTGAGALRVNIRAGAVLSWPCNANGTALSGSKWPHLRSEAQPAGRCDRKWHWHWGVARS